MHDPLLDRRREFLKDTIRLEIDFSQTDQSQVLTRRRSRSPSRPTPCG